MYHDIRNLNDTQFKSRLELKSFLNVEQFKNQIKFIKHNYKVIRPNEILDINNFNNQKYAILTFDDGLLDHLNVAKILYDNNLTGTFFIPTNAVKNRKIIKSHKIQFILSSNSEKELVGKILDKISTLKKERNILWEKFSISKWKNNYWTKEMVFVTNILRNHELGGIITDKLFSELVSKDEEDFSMDLYLNQTHLKTIIELGMDLGSHGYLSEDLTKIDQEKDIQKSTNYIKKFNVNNLYFSYPNGMYNKKTLEILKKYKYKISFTTIQNNISPPIDLLQIPRFDAPQTLLT